MELLEIIEEVKRLEALQVAKAQVMLNCMSARELMLDVEFLEFCGSYGLIRDMA